jgi:Protein of unknown function (DUF4079)
MELLTSIKVYSQFVHPLLMWVLLAMCLYAMYTGWQWRRVRSTTGDAKKALLQGKFNLKHHQIGSVVLALMVVGSIGGMAVTYVNNGKLFVGPHLIAGLGMTGLIAIAAALTPLMQKGAEWARLTHITINIAIIGLFGWQAVSGIEIIQRILKRISES